MPGIFIRWLILMIAIVTASYVLEGVQVESVLTVLFTAALLGFMNTFFRPILLLLTLPITILTLGLFTFVINAVLLMMASGVIPGFTVAGFGTALVAALVISIVVWILETLFRGGFGGRRIPPPGHGRGREGDYIDLERKPGDRWE